MRCRACSADAWAVYGCRLVRAHCGAARAYRGWLWLHVSGAKALVRLTIPRRSAAPWFGSLVALVRVLAVRVGVGVGVAHPEKKRVLVCLVVC